MYGKYNVDTLQNVIDTVNAMHRQQTELEKQSSGRAFGGHRYTGRKQVLEHSSKEVIRGITVLSQGRLPQEYFSDSQIKDILSEVQKMVQKGHPNYALGCRAYIPLQRYEIGNFCCG